MQYPKELFEKTYRKAKRILPILLFLFTIFATLLLLPNKTVFKYEYTRGQPWKYEDLISQFDFPVYKADGQISKEKDSIRENQLTYYTYSEEPKQRATELFREDFSKLTGLEVYNEQDTTALIKFADDFSEELEKVYNKGIIRPSLSSQDQNLIHIFKDGVAIRAFINDFLTEKEAFMNVHRALDSLKSEYEIQLPNLPVERYIDPNIQYDENNTRRMLKQQLDEVSPVKGMVKKGERIISKGEPVDAKKAAVLESLKKEYEQSKGNDAYNYLVSFGQLILITIIYMSLYFYIRVSEPKILRNIRNLLYILLMPLIFVVITSVFVRFVPLDVYLIPFAILPIITVNFHNLRLAIFHHTILILIISFFVAGSVEFIFTQFVVGFIAALGVSQLHNRRQILQTVALIIGIFVITYISFSLLREGNFNKISWARIALISVGSIFVLISYPLIYLFERIFGYLSNISLLEMSDLNHPLLKKLSEKAPGTFQHSLQVANIAESVASEIGGNPLLTRTGALFHDIGKMHEPQFFIENQLHGFNPHDKISPSESAEIIRKHVTEGVKIAKNHNLPEDIISFIRTHHGTSRIQFFYHAEKKLNPDKKPDEAVFSYPGPRPKTKEAAIVMFTDSVEAASRSMKEINAEAVNILVEQIVEKHIQTGQTQEADITFAEIGIVKRMLKEKIKNIYHTRIEYPKD
jgi:putative nucleotidyltransferase with HDIG domain